MTALETDLGTKLLIRRTTGCDLTVEEQELLANLQKAEGAFIASQSLAASGETGVSGTVRIGAPDGFGSQFLAPKLARLKKRHPSLSIRLVTVPRSFSLSQREADITVMIGRPTQGRLVARKLTDYSLSLYASRRYLEEHGQPKSPEELLRHQLVGYVDDLLYAPTLNFTEEFTIGIVHDFLAERYPELTLILPQQQVIRSYWTIIHENMRVLPRISAVTAFLAELVAGSRGQFVRMI